MVDTYGSVPDVTIVYSSTFASVIPIWLPEPILKYKFNDADALAAQAPANNINSKLLGHKILHISVVLRLNITCPFPDYLGIRLY
jgi:hypothetical protein